MRKKAGRIAGAGTLMALMALMAISAISAAIAQPSPATDTALASRQLSERMLSRLLLQAAAISGARVVAVGEHGYIIHSNDQGQTWTRAETPRRAMLTAVAFADDKSGWAVGHDGQILATRDGGLTWTEQRYKPDDKLPLFAVHAIDSTHVYAIGAYGLLLETTDSGTTWTPRTIVQEDRHLYAIAADASGRMAIAAEAGTLLVSGDHGRTWVTSPSPYKGSFFGLVGLVDGTLVAYGLRGNIFRSNDFGQSWNASTSDGFATLQGGGRLASGEIVLVGSAGTVLSSRNNGATFTRVPGQKSMTYSTVLPLAMGALLLGDAGVVRYRPADAATTPMTMPSGSQSTIPAGEKTPLAPASGTVSSAPPTR